MATFRTFHPVTDEAMEVDYGFTPAARGLRDRYGVPQEPDDEEAVTIYGVCGEDGREVELDREQEAAIEEQILESMKEEFVCPE